MGSDPGTESVVRRRTLLRSIGTVGASLGVVGANTGTTSAHETPRRDPTPESDSPSSENTQSDDTDGSRTPDPDSYEPIARLALPGAKELLTSTDGTVGYVAVTDGFATVDLSAPSDPAVLAERRDLLADREDGPLEQVNDVKVDGDRLLVVGPANGGSGAITAAVLVDVSDPTDPRQIAVHPTEFPIHNCWFGDDTAYLTANGIAGNPLVILSVGADDFEEIGRWSLFDHDERWRGVPSTVRSLHDVWVLDDVAYLAHWDAGTWLIDVSDPADPQYLADVGGRDAETLAALDRSSATRESTAPPGNSHYVATDASGSLMAVGRESWAIDGGETGGPSGIDIYDCDDPTDPTLRSRIEPPPSPEPTIGGLWTTAHNVGFAGDVLYASWYQGGVSRHDLSEPTTPRTLSWWRDPQTARFWTARAGIPGEYFVASDMGTAGGISSVARDAGIYVFPDSEGTQSPPPTPALRAPEPSAVSESGATPESSAGPRSRESTPTPARSPSTTGGSSSGSGGGVSSTRRAPGFGLGTSLLALGVGAWHRLHSDRRTK